MCAVIPEAYPERFQFRHIRDEEDDILFQASENALGFHCSDDWLEVSVVTAYEKGSRNKKGNVESSSSSEENRKRKWKVGDKCRAIYSAEDRYYEAKIIDISGNICAVEFLGYHDFEISKLKDLRKSDGKEFRKRQIKEARDYLLDCSVDEYGDTAVESDLSDNSYQGRRGNTPDIVPDPTVVNSVNHEPSSPMPYSGLPASPELPQYSGLPASPELPQYSGPPAPPELPQHSGLPAPPMLLQYPGPTCYISQMLNAWYMAGYHAGLYSARRENHCGQCFCCFNHSAHQCRN